MVPALSPVRWLWGYYITAEMPRLSPLSRTGAAGAMRSKGYDLQYLGDCQNSLDRSVETLQQAWIENRGWVCSPAPLLLLGILFRFLAGCCLLLYVSAQTSGWARFFAQSEMGAWKLAGKFFALLVGASLVIFLFAEVWVFGSQELHLAGETQPTLGARRRRGEGEARPRLRKSSSEGTLRCQGLVVLILLDYPVDLFLGQTHSFSCLNRGL
eukprot:g26965.t1